MNNDRVVITGLGIVSSIGFGWEMFWNNLIKGSSGISTISSIDTVQYKTKNGGEIKNFNPTNYVHPRRRHNYGRASQFAIVASKLALTQAKLELQNMDSQSLGVLLGTTMANIQDLEHINKVWIAEGEEKLRTNLIHRYPGNNLALDVAVELGVRPMCFVIPTACSAGNYCIGYGYDLIKHGQLEVAICGGSDSFSRIAFTGFNSLFTVAPSRCQPFDKNRKGMMLGEGAGILVLESMNFARKRNATILAEVLGYGLSCDASSMTLPNPEGVEAVLRRALKEANLSEDDIDYISAHGTGTKANDTIEAQAINRVFKKKRIPTSSIKSMLGHTMGAASAIEAISCVLATQYSILPPTINYESFDEECDVDCVPNIARNQRVNCALNNSFAFGGNNACLAIGRIN